MIKISRAVRVGGAVLCCQLLELSAVAAQELMYPGPRDVTVRDPIGLTITDPKSEARLDGLAFQQTRAASLHPEAFHPFRVIVPWPRAQADELKIDDMAEVIGPGEEQRLECAGGRVTVTPVRGEVCRNRVLQEDNTVEVADNVHVKVKFDRTSQEGILTLATDFIDEFGEVFSAAEVAFEKPESGEYLLRRDPERSANFELSISRGVVIVDLTQGVLSVETPENVRSTVLGTQVVIGVGADGATSMFVVSGTVALPDGSNATRGELVRLSVEGAVTGREAPPRQLASRLENVFSYNRHELWSAFQPWWAAPYVYIPAAIGVGTGGYFAGRAIFGGDKEVPVIISIPAPF